MLVKFATILAAVCVVVSATTTSSDTPDIANTSDSSASSTQDTSSPSPSTPETSSFASTKKDVPPSTSDKETSNPTLPTTEAPKATPTTAGTSKPTPMPAETIKPKPTTAETAKPTPMTAETIKPKPMMEETPKPIPATPETPATTPKPVTTMPTTPTPVPTVTIIAEDEATTLEEIQTTPEVIVEPVTTPKPKRPKKPTPSATPYPVDTCICHLDEYLTDVKKEVSKKGYGQGNFALWALEMQYIFEQETTTLGKKHGKKPSPRYDVDRGGIKFDVLNNPTICSCPKELDKIMVNFTLQHCDWKPEYTNLQSTEAKSLIHKLEHKMEKMFDAGSLVHHYESSMVVQLYPTMVEGETGVLGMVTLNHWWYDAEDKISESFEYAVENHMLRPYTSRMTDFQVQRALQNPEKHTERKHFVWRRFVTPFFILLGFLAVCTGVLIVWRCRSYRKANILLTHSAIPHKCIE